MRLYDRVGQEIGTRFHKTVSETEAAIKAEHNEFARMSANEIEFKRLHTDKENNERKANRGEQPTTIEDLFRKYNI